MKRYITAVLTLLLLLSVSACGNHIGGMENDSMAQDMETLPAAGDTETKPEPGLSDTGEMEENRVAEDQIYIKVGDNTLTAVLEDNASVNALKELLADGELTISASNYGGFEKVCSLGRKLPSNDKQTTTHAGDICLYNNNQIVIFYGSNTWAYTKLGKIAEADESELAKILSGKETEITLSVD